jgi:hypothetical protein
MLPRYDATVESLHDHPAAISPEQLLKACAIHRGRAGGPGGQHRNKVETAIHIVHEPTGIDGQASERRSQTDNHRVALFRLRVKLAVEHREFLPKFAQPSALWQSRCRGGKIGINPTHQDFPGVLAEAMDFVADCRFDVKQAAARLECSMSQLVKLLKVEPTALERVNDQRRSLGQHPLR